MSTVLFMQISSEEERGMKEGHKASKEGGREEGRKEGRNEGRRCACVAVGATETLLTTATGRCHSSFIRASTSVCRRVVVLLLLFAMKASVLLVAALATVAPLAVYSTETPCLTHTDCALHRGETCYFSYDAGAKDTTASPGFCFVETEETVSRQHRTHAKVGASMGRGGIVVQGEKAQSAVLKMLSGKSGYRVGAMGSPARFALQKADGKREDLITITANGDVTMKSKGLRTLSVVADSHLQVNGKNQWSIVTREDYTSDPATQTVPGASGWKSIPAVTGKNAVQVQVSRCGGMTLLGGVNYFDQAGSVAKPFKVPVAAGTSELRITARFHFIDMWLGQSGFLKVAFPTGEGADAVWGKSQVVWAKQYETAPNMEGDSPALKLLNVCGNEDVGEFQFSNPIDIVVPLPGRNANSAAADVEIKLEFGSTWAVPVDENKPTEGSWGISGIEIWQK